LLNDYAHKQPGNKWKFLAHQLTAIATAVGVSYLRKSLVGQSFPLRVINAVNLSNFSFVANMTSPQRTNVTRKPHKLLSPLGWSLERLLAATGTDSMEFHG